MRPEAVEAMAPFLAEAAANPSSAHRAGRAAKAALEEGREVIAEALGATPDEVIATSGGTEADNLAILGAVRARTAAVGSGSVVVGAFEHHAVLSPVARLEREGVVVRRVPATPEGVIDLDALADAVDDSTALVSLMLVNNEVGTIQPLDELAALLGERAPGALLHTDAVQAVSWLDVADVTTPADLVAISAHKFGGPKGVGALVVRRGTPLQPILEGGGQERGARAGTVNVGGVVAMAAAAQAATRTRGATSARIGGLRDRLLAGLCERVEGLRPTVPADRTVAGSCHVIVDGIDAETLLVALDRAGVCAASGAACSSGAIEPSHVLLAMGRSRDDARHGIRLSLGWTSTDADVDAALTAFPAAVQRLRHAA
jgi:cysteine desulfurase